MHNKQLSPCCFERKDGTRRKATPETGKPYCFFHFYDPAREKQRAAARRTGALAAHRPKPILAPRPLKTASDVFELPGECVLRFRRGAVDLEFCVGTGLISRTLLQAFEMSAREQATTDLQATPPRLALPPPESK
jgi:hypothetical protein